MIICFCPSKLRTKPDMLTRWWDIYPKEGDSDYAKVNLQNLCVHLFIKDYYKSCMACARSKASWHWPYGNLRQLLIPEKPWNSISMDFTKQLPSSEGFTAILVIIDQLFKQAIFIPTYDMITSMQLTRLFILHVFFKHGVLSHVTSDCGMEFVSHFFRSLRKALNMRLHFTSGYHPEGDGQTKHTNQTLE